MSVDSDTYGGIGFLIIAGVAAYIYWVGGINTVWYAAEYQVSTDKVHVDAKPKDCDFMHAPLGDKACHYKAAVTVYNALGQVVGGDNAPKYGYDTKTGKPIVSYDGKNWGWFSGANIPDPKADSVVVGWSKVAD